MCTYFHTSFHIVSGYFAFRQFVFCPSTLAWMMTHIITLELLICMRIILWAKLTLRCRGTHYLWYLVCSFLRGGCVARRSEKERTYASSYKMTTKTEKNENHGVNVPQFWRWHFLNVSFKRMLTCRCYGLGSILHTDDASHHLITVIVVYKVCCINSIDGWLTMENRIYTFAHQPSLKGIPFRIYIFSEFQLIWFCLSVSHFPLSMTHPYIFLYIHAGANE